jgi:membrane glycosyltransferase
MEDEEKFKAQPVERRQVSDRRQARTKPLSKYSVKGRRKKARRRSESADYYVDWYEPRYFVLISLILLLCVFDAYLTLKILSLGGNELNPLMLIFIRKKPVLAIALKYLITVLGVFIIVIHKNFIIFRKVRVSTLIYLFFAIYGFLIVYEAIVLSHARGHLP